MEENEKNANHEMNGSSDTDTVTASLWEETVELSEEDECRTEALSNSISEPEIQHYGIAHKEKPSDILERREGKPLKYLQHVIDEKVAEDDPTYRRYRK